MKKDIHGQLSKNLKRTYSQMQKCYEQMETTATIKEKMGLLLQLETLKVKAIELNKMIVELENKK